MIKKFVATLVVLGGLAACVPDETSTTASNSKPQQACTAEEQSRLMAAAEVLLKRGFHPYNGERILGKSAMGVDCPYDGPWQANFKNSPNRSTGQAGELVDVEYNIENGELFDYSDPVRLAETLPDCYRGGPLHKTCKPNYHPMFGDPKLTDTSATVCYPNPELQANPKLRELEGYEMSFPEEVCDTPPAPRACKLDRDWKKFCSHPEASYDGCWGFPKADIVTGPPPREVKSRIDLARAKKVQEAKVLAAAPKPRVLPGTICEHLNWGPNKDWGIDQFR